MWIVSQAPPHQFGKSCIKAALCLYHFLKIRINTAFQVHTIVVVNCHVTLWPIAGNVRLFNYSCLHVRFYVPIFSTVFVSYRGPNKVGRKNPSPVFTGGIYRYFLAWQIRLKWQILVNNGKYNFFAMKYWQIMTFSYKMKQISFEKIVK